MTLQKTKGRNETHKQLGLSLKRQTLKNYCQKIQRQSNRILKDLKEQMVREAQTPYCIS